jgi:poly-gamma-glutamate synthesis protein (capsule biosynthesis protein)
MQSKAGKSAKVILAAVGDISFKGEMEAVALERGMDYLFGAIQPELDKADLRFGNLESVFWPSSFPLDELGKKALCAADSVAKSLKVARFDIMNLAQNHILDCGTIGLDHTRATLRKMGITCFGAGKSPTAARRPAIIERNGLRIGFLGYQEDCNYTYGHIGAGPAYLREEIILRDMRKLRPNVDCLVLSLHADIEFMETPSVWRRDLARRLARAGADLILCTHPHVPQGIERVGRSLVAYSLGNCLFDAHQNQYMRDNGPHTQHSFLLRVELTQKGVGEFTRIPFAISEPPGQRPVPYKGAERRKAMRYLERLDKAVANDALVQANWRRVCMELLEVYLRRCEGLSAEEFMERWSWVLMWVQENRSWTTEILQMARERFEQAAREHKPYLQFRRPSAKYE